MKYTDINAQAVDQWVADGWEWGTPIDHETYVRAQQGDWQVLLTPTKPVPRSWFGELRGGTGAGVGQRRRTADAGFCRGGGCMHPAGLFQGPAGVGCKVAQREATPSSWCGLT